MKPAALLAFVVLLTACASSVPVPEDQFYQLEMNRPEHTLPSPLLTGGMEIDYTAADPLRSGRAVLYSDNSEPLRLQRYHYAFWIDQPPRLVHRELVNYLREGGAIDEVVEPGQRRASAYRLSTRLLKFEQYRSGGRVEVEVKMQASLQALSAGPVLWTHTYVQRQPANGTGMHATAAAMQAALTGVFRALQNDLTADSGVRQ